MKTDIKRVQQNDIQLIIIIMRKFFLNALAFAAIASAVTLTSCSDDENANTDGGDDLGTTVQLSGTVSETMTLDASKEYVLTGTLTVPDGATLVIPAGTTIKANQGFDKYILVAQGGRIEARGTADNPIVFTANSDNASAGFWGGLVINGYAPISGNASGTTAATEVDNNQMYGGTDAADNSGVLQYVELLYTGARSSADIEHNGLTLNGVGSGTQISNIYISEGADDAIEFFGGSVNVTNLLAVNCDDDMFDFTQGYSGTLSNCYGVWESGFTSTEEDPRGVEADGNLDGDGPDHTPQANFNISGMTIANYSEAQSMQDAIKVRRGATAHITNALVTGNGAIENLIDLTDSKGGANTATEMSVTNSATQLTGTLINEDGEYAGVEVVAGNTGADNSVFVWTGYEFPEATAPEVIAEGNLPAEITTAMALEAGKEYFIDGSVHVKEGGSLTIPAGMTIRARQGFDSFILVERGGKIYADGTEDAPITFTADSETATAGYWGGIILNGRARISGAGDGVNEAATEVDNNIMYGGDDNADNSGRLTYVRILYSGARSSADIEHNGLTLNAVGNGTQISNIYIAEGADDAIEFFGGSVNVSNLLAVNCDDDMFDFTQGYCGTLSNCYGRWESSFTSTEEDPRGVEADGNLDGNGPDHTPQSDFTIENMTIENLASAQSMQDAIKIRRGAAAHITNAFVTGSGAIENLIDLTDSKGDAAASTEISVTNSATNVTSAEINQNGTYEGVGIVEGNAGCPTTGFGWTGYSF